MLCPYKIGVWRGGRGKSRASPAPTGVRAEQGLGRKASVYQFLTGNRYTRAMKNRTHVVRTLSFLYLSFLVPALCAQDTTQKVQLPNGKLLGDVPGAPRQINNLPTAAAISPDGRFAVLLHSGFGAYTSGEKQSLTVLNLETNELADFPDDRLGSKARQTYFLGLAFSLDGKHIYASMASLTDPLGKKKGSTGNGIAVYSFENGRVAPERFLPLTPREKIPSGKERRAGFKDVTYPAGLSVGQ